MNFDLKTPCPNCPFRSDIRPYLTKARVDQLESDLERCTFTCHKTTVHDGDSGDMKDGPNAQHCAGALILLEKLRRPSQMMRIAERLGLYDRTKLEMKAPVFDSFRKMRKVQE